MNEYNKLDGTWKNGIFKLVIRKNKYVSFYNGFRYGKGIITYDDVNFSLTSTHARSRLFFWAPFVECVKGNYSIGGEKVTISNIEGRYIEQNGIWAH